jgi:hypothetical protein
MRYFVPISPSPPYQVRGRLLISLLSRDRGNKKVDIMGASKYDNGEGKRRRLRYGGGEARRMTKGKE